MTRPNASTTGATAMTTPSRRELLQGMACGFGGMALSGLLAEESRAADPLASRKPHFPGKAKHVIDPVQKVVARSPSR